ncbi:MAG: hypothetical protein HQK52_04835 [Oligoflexia bacterium]|nr:hypothetical protein [Oligoflexia bacterium]
MSLRPHFDYVFLGNSFFTYLLVTIILKRNRKQNPQVLVVTDPKWSQQQEEWPLLLTGPEKCYLEALGRDLAIPPLKHLVNYLTPQTTEIALEGVQLCLGLSARLRLQELLRKLPHQWFFSEHALLAKSLEKLAKQEKQELELDALLENLFVGIVEEIRKHKKGGSGKRLGEKELSHFLQRSLAPEMASMILYFCKNYPLKFKELHSLVAGSERRFKRITSRPLPLMGPLNNWMQARDLIVCLRKAMHFAGGDEALVRDLLMLLLTVIAKSYSLKLDALKSDLVSYFLRKGGAMVNGTVEDVARLRRNEGDGVALQLSNAHGVVLGKQIFSSRMGVQSSKQEQSLIQGWQQFNRGQIAKRSVLVEDWGTLTLLQELESFSLRV